MKVICFDSIPKSHSSHILPLTKWQIIWAIEKPESPKNNPRYPPIADTRAFLSNMSTSFSTDTWLLDKNMNALLRRVRPRDFGDCFLITVYLPRQRRRWRKCYLLCITCLYVVFLQERGHWLTSWFTMPWRTVLKKLLAMHSWDFFVVHHGKWLRVSVTVFVWDIWHAGEKQKKLLIHEWFPTVLIVSLTALICQAFYLFECSSCPLHDAVISVVILPIKAFTIGELHGFSDWNLQINHIPGSNVLICTELDKMKNWKIFINSLTTDSTGPIQ